MVPTIPWCILLGRVLLLGVRGGGGKEKRRGKKGEPFFEKNKNKPQ